MSLVRVRALQVPLPASGFGDMILIAVHRHRHDYSWQAIDVLGREKPIGCHFEATARRVAADLNQSLGYRRRYIVVRR